MKKSTVTYLEMRSLNALKGKNSSSGLEVQECHVKQYRVNRFLYEFVGEAWQWTDRLSWTDEQWQSLAESDNVRTWIATYIGSLAGYFELRQENADVEILSFGLASPFIGRGFGGVLLTQAVKAAYEWKKTKRLWLHTCAEDHPAALNNYLARGFRVYKEETVELK